MMVSEEEESGVAGSQFVLTLVLSLSLLELVRDHIIIMNMWQLTFFSVCKWVEFNKSCNDIPLGASRILSSSLFVAGTILTSSLAIFTYYRL